METSRVGFLGGGQLALMLADAVLRLGRRPVVLAENSLCPAALAHPDSVSGGPYNEEALRVFFSRVDHVIFENEFVDCELIQRISKKISKQRSIQFYPELKVIQKLQDKLEQKKMLQELQIPTADFFVLNAETSLESQIDDACRRWGGSCVLKWAKMGYDGKGVLVLNPGAKGLKKAEVFCSEAAKKGSAVYAERKIDFVRELALVSVFSVQGEFLAYPLVISEQTHGICSRVSGPATALGVSVEIEKSARHFAKKVAESSRLTGAFALEFFETPDGELWVNEIAPRVHNSGHYTQDACSTDQFENHWRAVLGLPLGEVSSSPCFAMLNLLGPDFEVKLEEGGGLPTPGPRSHLHWYHKNGIRAGRKLGHLNAVASSVHDLEGLWEELNGSHEEWLKRLKLPNSRSTGSPSESEGGL